MTQAEPRDLYRENLTPTQRATPLQHTIDPGFVHHRLIQTLIGPEGMQVIDDLVAKLPPELPEWMRGVRIDHIYTFVLLLFCNKNEIPSLGQIISAERGLLFCSTEQLAPCPDVYGRERAVSVWVPPGPTRWRVEFHYSTEHIASDTIRSELHDGATISLVAQFHHKQDDTLVFHPLVIGNPWLQEADEKPTFDIMWYGSVFFENFVEDFDEFARVREAKTPDSCEPMSRISERAFKTCLQRLLGDSSRCDWGGETSDYFTAHLHLGGAAESVVRSFSRDPHVSNRWDSTIWARTTIRSSVSPTSRQTCSSSSTVTTSCPQCARLCAPLPCSPLIPAATA